MFDLSDYLYMIIIGLIKTIIIVGGIIFVGNLFIFNHSLGITIADALEIPHDLALTITSFGFVNNVTVVFSVFELGLIAFVINRLNKLAFFNKVFDKFIYFMEGF